ncbi:MAG: glycosyltransferase family 39 protein [Candidatus Sumerlaeaceae bacterium]|nr:glycosyltransferase family 39 protein [Candidatus Sumerlaeaceae bacterium]
MTDRMRPDAATRYVLIALFGAAVGLRVIFLGSLPPGMFRDEAEKAYNAWCLALTGRDLAGNFLPLFINVFGVTTSAIYQYAAVPFVAVLGLNEWSARLPAAAVGSATVAVNYLYMARACGRGPALLATGFLAFSPWHILFSRWAQQGIFLPLLLSSAMLAWQAWRNGLRAGLPAAAALFSLAIYAYDVARLFVPLLMLGLVASQWRTLLRQWRLVLVSLVVFLVVASPTIHLVLNSPAAAQARFRAISIFQDGSTPLSAARQFAFNYLNHFSPTFLLVRGDAEWRHSAGTGHVTAFELFCLLAGLAAVGLQRKPSDRIWIWWLLLAPIPASLTREGVPHALRAIMFVPAIQNLAGIGAAWLLEQAPPARRSLLVRAAVLAGLAAFLPFAASYFGPYAGRSAVNWQYGVKHALEIADAVEPPVHRIVFYNVTGAEYLVAFYRRTPPSAIREADAVWTRHAFAPFNAPLDRVCQAHDRHAAFIMLPVFTPPCADKVVLIEAPRGGGPVMAVYFNDALSSPTADIR